MPTVPLATNINTSAEGRSPLSNPTPENLLMAAATMDSLGKFSQPEPAKARRPVRRGSMKVLR